MALDDETDFFEELDVQAQATVESIEATEEVQVSPGAEVAGGKVAELDRIEPAASHAISMAVDRRVSRSGFAPSAAVADARRAF